MSRLIYFNLSILAIMTTTPKKKEWSIPEDLLPFVSEKCPNGTYLVCSVCSAYDLDQRKLGRVFMRSNFWTSYFCDHVRDRIERPRTYVRR